MIIIETCPMCGHDLIDIVLCTYPLRPYKYCPQCGWSCPDEPTEVMRVPFRENGFGFKSNPCANCPTNPKNGGSGICFCTLGLPDIR